MKAFIYVSVIILLLLTGCGKDENNSNDNEKQSNDMKTGQRIGVVVDKIDAGSYSYLQLKENDNTYWIAVPIMQVEKGEKIYFSKFMKMENFRSETLDRTFESVLFVSDASKSAKQTDLMTIHPNTKSLVQEKISVEKVPNGKTIKQIFSEKETLKGKSVKVRGKVVKVNPGILDRNWIHIQDGTADGNNFDLLVTSIDKAVVGDIIIAEGQLAVDKDFGAGYTYPVLIENVKITRE